MSVREAVLAAVTTKLQTVPSATVLRNAALPERVPAGGLVILRDGAPGQPEVHLSPLAYIYTHAAEIDVLVEDHDPAARDAAFDTLVNAIADAVHADRKLGGLADWVEAQAPAPVQLPAEGSEALKAATITLEITYESPDSLA